MSWKCKDCGNAGLFEACATQYRKVVINANGDYVNTIEQVGEMDIDNNLVECCNCGSDQVVWVEPKQVELGAVAN